MKNFIALAFLFISINCFAQNKDSIPKYDYLNTGKSRGLHINSVLLKKSSDTNSIVVINDKIYKSSATEIKRYRKSELILIMHIRDSVSLSGIRNIFIYKTKRQ